MISQHFKSFVGRVALRDSTQIDADVWSGKLDAMPAGIEQNGIAADGTPSGL
jgi:hypothetical protein